MQNQLKTTLKTQIIRRYLFAAGIFVATLAQAQVSVNVNLGVPPVWAPADRVEAQYYYLPEIDAYYDVPSSRFIYVNNGNWIRSSNLPYRYRNYNLQSGKVVYLTDYKGSKPYVYHKKHKTQYVTVNNVNRAEFNNGNGAKNGNGNGKGKGNKKD
jgi:hypothetical protein